jgi:hypothetical protein
MIRTVAITLIIFYTSNTLRSQDSIAFTFESFLTQVKKYHPMMQNVALIKQSAEANLLKAKGGFDPKIAHETNGKNFKNKDYYQLSNTALKIPTWFGVELKGGYELNRGDFLNPEHQTPGSGLWYGGISVPIGKNLVIDERRKILRQAQVVLEQSEIEQRMMQSDLLLHAGEAYWDWYKAYHALEITKEGLRLAEERLNAIKVSAELGEHARIDTLEATLLRDSRALEYEQSKANHLYNKYLMSSYLWTNDLIPLELKEKAYPPFVSDIGSIYHNINIDTTVWLRNYDYKLELLKIDERYKKEQLKPDLTLSYNPILQPTNGGFLPFSNNNMKFGVNVSIPIFLRKERGDLASVRIKLKATELDQTIKRLELTNKVIAVKSQIESFEKQIVLQESMVNSSKKMRDAELIKFDLGESSLFLVNSRELKYLESKLKGIELMSKYKLYQTQLTWLLTN